MQIVVGIKDSESGQRLVSRLRDLQFSDPNFHLLHILESPGGSLGKVLLTASEGDYFAQYLNTERQKAKAFLTVLRDELTQKDRESSFEIIEGTAGEELLTAAKRHESDLIGIHHVAKTGMRGFLPPRVSRKLLIESQTSLFVDKDSDAPMDRAVFATDLSPYAERCANRLVQLQPKGIRELTLMVAFPKNLAAHLSLLLGRLEIDIEKWAKERFQQEIDALAQKLGEAGWECRTEVRKESVHEAIGASMEENQAGLLILGAQGHGFVERMTLGSISMHEVMYGRYPTLLLRD